MAKKERNFKFFSQRHYNPERANDVSRVQRPSSGGHPLRGVQGGHGRLPQVGHPSFRKLENPILNARVAGLGFTRRRRMRRRRRRRRRKRRRAKERIRMNGRQIHVSSSAISCTSFKWKKRMNAQFSNQQLVFQFIKSRENIQRFPKIHIFESGKFTKSYS